MVSQICRGVRHVQCVAEAIEEFLLQMSANGRKPSSVSSYARELALLRGLPRGHRLATITTGDVSRFLASPRGQFRKDGEEKALTTLNPTSTVSEVEC